jgi:hypothetical protein
MLTSPLGDTIMTTQSGSLGGLFGRSSSEESIDADSKAGKSSTTTGGGQDREPVVVWEAANKMEAQIVKGRLESHGIPAIIRGEALGTIYGLTAGGLAATDVLVPAPLAERATEILNTKVEWEESDLDADEGAHGEGRDTH